MLGKRKIESNFCFESAVLTSWKDVTCPRCEVSLLALFTTMPKDLLLFRMIKKIMIKLPKICTHTHKTYNLGQWIISLEMITLGIEPGLLIWPWPLNHVSWDDNPSHWTMSFQCFLFKKLVDILNGHFIIDE